MSDERAHSATTEDETPPQAARWTRRRAGILLAIVVLAALLRGWAVLRLPVDYDEPVYLQAGADYAAAMRAADWNGIIDYPGTREHPALVKLLYGLTALAVGPDAEYAVDLYAARGLSALLGTLAVLLLAWVSPLAGAFLAVHTLAVKYTSQVYLEALPLLACLGAVLAFRRSKGRDRWFWLSALALGVTAASKYTYLPIGLVILYLAIWEKRVRWHRLVAYGAVVLGVFWLLNPTLWHDPLSRLLDSVFYHAHYSQGPVVQLAAYPWYQPLDWLSRSGPSTWHPEVFFYIGLDGVIFLLALPGLYWEWRQRRWVAVWIVAGLLVLLVWPTKWPQYTLILTPALCLAAATTVRQFYRLLKGNEAYWEWIRQMVPAPPLAFWVILGVIALAIVVGYTASTLQLTLGRLGWSHLTQQSALLPSNTVYDVVAGAEEQMILATDRGAAIWEPPAGADLPDRWVVLTAQTSGLPSDRVQAVAVAPGGRLWLGTDAGLARYDGEDWQVYRAGDLGLVDARVYALAVDRRGRLWAGTAAGAAVFDGQAWTAYTTATSGLADNWVMALEIEPQPGGDRVWFGTRMGISRLDTASGQWTSFPEVFDPSWGGVADLLLDSTGHLWAGTLGGGLGRWDGATWQFYRTGNSEIPFNTVNAVAEVEPGVLWVGTALPAEVGGVLAEFDGQDWKSYTRRESGFSGAEPMAIAVDAQGRRWIGTRTSGVDIYQPDR